ncbi:MAG: hypothetical protein LBT53_01365 [Puniceicoccales bacterium]|jgi:3-deoxy-D-manno-octulosonic-acid transferase|nr:hypothetical protein [Puniceicoccales bacterium]
MGAGMVCGMIWLYRLLFVPTFLALFPRQLLRMLRRGGYGRDFHHRLGLFPKLPAKRAGVRRIWLQAVSVGEVNAVVPLVRELSAKGENEVVLTTTTSTGYAIARERLGAVALATGIFPIDFLPCSRLAWSRIQPDLVVLMEGELWPEHLRTAQKRKVPAVLVNARISDRSFRRYTRFPTVAKQLFGALACAGVGTHEDARRLSHLGLPCEKIILTGNLKFDAAAATPTSPPPAATAAPAPADAEITRDALGFGDAPDAPILLGSSTWPGEEQMLLEVLRQARKRDIPLRLLLVPRHAERRNEIAALLEKTDWHWHLRSKTPDASAASADVCVADTTGELSRLTRLATLAFIGKSLPPNNGGQSPVDCAAAGVPMVYGPFMSNFREACRNLEADHAALCACHAGEAAAALLSLLEDAPQRASMSKNAKRWHIDNQGATAATLLMLEKINFAPPPNEVIQSS